LDLYWEYGRHSLPFGRIDPLINNAAIYYDLELGKATLDGRKVMDVNVFGVMLACWAQLAGLSTYREGGPPVSLARIAVTDVRNKEVDEAPRHRFVAYGDEGG
jgi:NAD(P)-dependent dehydrogenase (short-subunit alcohol dehydrogenase family)